MSWLHHYILQKIAEYVVAFVLEVTDQACREEIIAILLGIEETRGNEGEYGPRRLFALSANTRP